MKTLFKTLASLQAILISIVLYVLFNPSLYYAVNYNQRPLLFIAFILLSVSTIVCTIKGQTKQAA